MEEGEREGKDLISWVGKDMCGEKDIVNRGKGRNGRSGKWKVKK